MHRESIKRSTLCPCPKHFHWFESMLCFSLSCTLSIPFDVAVCFNFCRRMCIGSCKQLIYQLNSHLKNAHKCVQQTKKMNKKNTHATVYVSRNRTKEMMKRLLHSCNVRVELWFVCRFHFIHILYKKRNNNIKKNHAHTLTYKRKISSFFTFDKIS